MTIKVLGTGCPGCLRLEKNVRQALQELDIKAEVTKVANITEIVGYGVMRTPAIVIDEQIKISGKVADIDELKEIIKGSS